MKIVYIRETEETCDIIKRIIVRIKRFLRIINIENKNNNTIYYLPIFKDSNISKHSVRKLSNKISKVLEEEDSNNIVLSEYLENNKLFKNYLYGKNINILNGNFLFKCLNYKILEYIFNVSNKEIKCRRNYIID